MYCRECGKPLLESDKFCSYCGTPVKKITPSEEPMFRTEEGARKDRAKTAPLPSFKTEAPAEEKKGERLIFEAIGDSIKWDTDAFPSKTRKKTEDVDFHWNLSEDEFRNRPARREPRQQRQTASSPWGADTDDKPKSTGLKPSDTNSWDELFEGTRSDEKRTRQAKRDSLETYWEEMFKRDEAVQSTRPDQRSTAELTEMPPRRVSISRDDISRGIGDEGGERLDQNKLEETMTLSREEMEGALRGEREEREEKPEKPEKTETRENRVVAELASMAAAGIGAGPTFVPKGVDAVTLQEDKESKPAPTEQEKELTGTELEQELFREMDEPMTEAQKMRARQTEKIDKFYTFNKKNEEFQKLLDQEYERFKKSREEEDYAEDLYKLGDEDFFEDFSKGKHSQAEEMARARQTFFHTDEFAELKDILEKEEAAGKVAEEGAVPETPASEETAEAAEAESLQAPAEPSEAIEPETEEEPEAPHRPRKQKKSFFDRLFGRDEEDEPETGAAGAAAAAAAVVTGAAVHEALKEEEPAAEEVPAEEIAETPDKAMMEEEPVEEVSEETVAGEPAEAPAEEPETASIVFEPEEEPEAAAPDEKSVSEQAEEPAAAEEAPAEESAAAEEAPAEAAEAAEEALVDEPAAAEIAPAEESEEEPAAEPEAASIVFGPDGEAVLEVEEAVRKVLGEEPAEEAAEMTEEAPAEEPEAAEVVEEAPAEAAEAVEEAPAEEPEAVEEKPAEEPVPEADASAEAEEPAEAEPMPVAEAPEGPEAEAEEAETETVARTTEPTRVYEKGDIPTPTTEEEQATAFEESRAEAWDAFFSDDEDVNAGNTFDAENEAGELSEKERHGASILASILVVILVFLLALIVVRLAMPDSIISIKLDQITEKILGLFHGGAAAAIIQHLM